MKPKFDINDMCITQNANSLAIVKIMGIHINKFGVKYDVLFDGDDTSLTSMIDEKYLFPDLPSYIQTITEKASALRYGHQVRIAIENGEE